MTAILVLGRSDVFDNDGDFCAWVGYVADRIDGACGFEVGVEDRARRDVQTDTIRGADEATCEAVETAKSELWDRFCRDSTAWPSREPAGT